MTSSNGLTGQYPISRKSAFSLRSSDWVRNQSIFNVESIAASLKNNTGLMEVKIAMLEYSREYLETSEDLRDLAEYFRLMRK